MIKAIAAIDSKRGLANEQGIAWQGRIPGDIKYVHEQIEGHPMIMGYGTYLEFTKPMMQASETYVATRKDVELNPGFTAVDNAVDFLQKYKGDGPDMWNFGGAGLFAATLAITDEIHITQLEGDFNSTKFFPEFKDDFVMKTESDPVTEGDITYTFQVWKRK
ncbi:MAG: dihydrofolate reductase [bacterium]|nr:dihydrofolate reductase [bacterium]